MAAPLSEVASHAQAFVAIVFDGFNLIEPHRNVLAEALIYFGFARTGTSGFRLLQNVLRELFELFDGISKAINVHGYFLAGYKRS